MILHQLHAQLDRVARRIARDRFLRRTACACFLAAAAMLVLWTATVVVQPSRLPEVVVQPSRLQLAGETPAPQSQPQSQPHFVLVLAAATLSLALLTVLLRAGRVTRRTAARSIELKFPDLNQRLLAAIEQQPSVATGRLSYLQQQVVGEALAHARTHNWLQVLPASRLAASLVLQIAGLALFATSVTLLWQRPAVVAGVDRKSLAAQTSAVGEVINFDIAVEPGNAEIERGTDLLVLARFPRQLPPDATLVATGNNARGALQNPKRAGVAGAGVFTKPRPFFQLNGARDRGFPSVQPRPPSVGLETASNPIRIPLSRSLDDPVFGGRLTAIDADTRYYVEYAGRRTPEYRVTVFDFPALERLDAVIRFPEYTGLPETTLADTRRVSVVEGSQITLVGLANKPLAAAGLIDENDAASPFNLQTADARRFELTLAPTKSARYILQLTDDKGRHNKLPYELVIEVTPNRPPDLKLAFPAKDVRVSPLEELSLEATAWDDFGLQQYGLIYAIAGQEPQTLVLGEAVPPQQRRDVAHLLSFETLEAEPDQLLSYYFFADDFGPDGEIRRTFSDMYFAEVRHFEEIFREGQQPPGGGSQQQGGGSPQSQELEELAKLQKQIVNATWNVIRRETSAQPSAAFAADVKLIAETQQSALDQLHKLREKLQDPKSQAFVAGVVEQMTAAVEQLIQSVDENEADLLSAALSSEQAAYQGLLKLRAREHKVSQNKSGGGGGGGGGNRSQQQMNQLELTNKENRYQTERVASAQQASAAGGEQLQVLNRLRELARRQQGLNEKLKELENALREAKSAEEQEELRRRLKRLRDEQQEMLRDVDELRNRMDRPENQQQMADDRRKLDETREKIRQTSDALQEGRLSQALNTGTRTERDLNNLKEDFRQRTAGQFADEMQDLRRQSRGLADKQQAIAEEMKSLHDSRRRKLRDSETRQQLARDIEQQKEQLEQILDRSKEVVRKAEETEPLLSRKLYDAIRRAREDQPAERLQSASQLIDEGLHKEADEAHRQASRGIDHLRQGIEQAAESVLGSETEALRTAQQQLDDLTKALKNEVAQADAAGQRQTAPGPKQTADASGQEAGDRRQESGGRGQEAGDGGSGQEASDPQPSTLNPQPSTNPQPSAGGLAGGAGEHGGSMQPLTGEGFRDWSDKLREVEELVEDPQLRDAAARVRDRARSMRVDFKRHSKEPNWDLVRDTLLEPLVELRQQLAEEIARRESNETLVPIDRDPVPERFSDLVEEYYKRLGSSPRSDLDGSGKK